MSRRSRVRRCLGVALLFTSSAWAQPARAFCREVTVAPPVDYEPTDAGCFSGSDEAGAGLPALFWRNQCVTYSLQSDASPKFVSLSQARAVAFQAFQRWTAAPCDGGTPSIFASELPPVACADPTATAHANPIIFRDTSWPYGDASNSLGLTTLTVDLSTGEILGAAIEINTAQYTIVAQGPVPAGAYDLASILTHEAGHFLGLAHSETAEAVMYTHYQPGLDGLRADDVGGICSIYAPDGTRNTQQGPFAAESCFTQPAAGYSTQCAALDGGIVGELPVDVGAAPATRPSVNLWLCDAAAPARPCSGTGAALGVLALVWFGRRLGARRRRQGLASLVAAATGACGSAGCTPVGGPGCGPGVAPLAEGGSDPADATRDAEVDAPDGEESAPADSSSAATGDAGANPVASPASVAYVRFANWSSDAPAADFCVAAHGSSAFVGPFVSGLPGSADAGLTGLSFPEVSAYSTLSPGSYDVRVVVAGSGDCSAGIAPDAVSLPALNAGASATIALVGDETPSGGDPGLRVEGFLDDRETGTSSVSVRFINASPAVGQADLLAASATGTIPPPRTAFVSLFVGVAFGAAGRSADDGGDSNRYLPLTPSTQMVFGARAADALSGPDLVDSPALPQFGGNVVTLVLLGRSGAAPTLLRCMDSAGVVGPLSDCSP